jgi:hypothetical protein
MSDGKAVWAVCFGLLVVTSKAWAIEVDTRSEDLTLEIIPEIQSRLEVAGLVSDEIEAEHASDQGQPVRVQRRFRGWIAAAIEAPSRLMNWFVMTPSFPSATGRACCG